MKKNGFTVVELLASFTLTMIIVVFLFEIVLELKNTYVSNTIKTQVLMQNSAFVTVLNNKFSNASIDSTSYGGTGNVYIINTSDGSSYNLTITENQIIFDGQKFKMPEGVAIENINFIDGGVIVNNDGSNSSYFSISYDVVGDDLDKKIHFNYVYSY